MGRSTGRDMVFPPKLLDAGLSELSGTAPCALGDGSTGPSVGSSPSRVSVGSMVPSTRASLASVALSPCVSSWVGSPATGRDKAAALSTAPDISCPPSSSAINVASRFLVTTNVLSGGRRRPASRRVASDADALGISHFGQNRAGDVNERLPVARKAL
ncbi:hypothetical protein CAUPRSCDRAFT_11938 [Caulochytrium protostelioides]|uniref:Uncharacterized protein n=1 Tax=Caulochytrium protostelioides TaxID=1555241 RepID=A0A4P9WSY4_9FUNG|nr:hypothetical protein CAUPRSCDRAFT_11938 [Caulochytrium protostelioides]